jgi:H+/Cl- antiporter ClcA
MFRSAPRLVRLLACGAVVGVLAGLSSAGFLETLKWVTVQRVAHGWLLFLLPLGGLVVGLAYHHVGGRASGGSVMIIDEIHEPTEWVPRRLAPMVFGGTVLTHLFGGSAGREGTAIQMSGSLTDGFSRLFHIEGDERRLLLIAAISGGFGAVFGVPFAGCVFALEVQDRAVRRYVAVLPALTASLVGDQVVRLVHVHHTPLPELSTIHLTVGLLGKFVVAGVAFGLTSVLFIHLTHAVKRQFASFVGWPPLRPFIGGVGVVALTELVGNRDYLGLSLPLMTAAVTGGGIVAGAFGLKLAFTALTLGSGFQGGEVTPLFVIGATLGVTMGRLLGAPIPVMAASGLLAVFAGAANTPVACTVMGIELFGGKAVVLFAIACVVSYLCSTRRSIYR